MYFKKINTSSSQSLLNSKGSTTSFKNNTLTKKHNHLGVFLGVLSLTTTLNAADIVSMKADSLKFSLDEKGYISSLKDTKTGKEYIVDSPQSYLLKTAPKFNGQFKEPSSAKVLQSAENETLVEFTYDWGAKLDVKIINHGKYFSFEIVKVSCSKKVAAIRWGIVRVKMHQPMARWIALARSKDYTIAFMPLSLNTVGMGNNNVASNYMEKGTALFLESYDHTTSKSLSIEYKTDKMDVTPLPRVTVKGSKIAIAGCKAGRDRELDMIEHIELSENLPHPMYKGKWIKRSKEPSRTSLWINHTQKNTDEIIALCKELGIANICRFQGFFKNWGHFDVDKNLYPGGWPAVKADADKCLQNGINLGFYSLTYFLKPMAETEPFIAPIPDPRLAKLKIPLTLLSNLSANDKKELRIKYNDDLYNIWGKQYAHWYKVLKIGNELIEAKEMAIEGDDLVFRKLTRGAFKGTPAPHNKQSPVTAMVASGYHSLFPGTVEMHAEQAKIQAKLIADNHLKLCILDGFGEATGHGSLAKNQFMETLHNELQDKEILITFSPSQSILNWHNVSYFSWGEYELYKGFRGTMIDYRLGRQLEIGANLIPKKLGQYYPDEKTTTEDIEWLMARAAGWDSGIDLHFDIKKIKSNPNYNQICALFKLWEKARINDVFTEEEKMRLRQTDSIYSLSHTNGKWNLKFKKFWSDSKMKLLPPSVFKITSEGNVKVEKCSIAWRQTHDPGIHLAAAISDDLIFSGGSQSATAKVVYPLPKDKRSGESQKLQFVLRVKNTSPSGGIKNIKIKVGDHTLLIPTTLKPGEYIANPHLLQKVFVYDSKTDMVKREVFIPQFNPYWFLPDLKKGTEQKISVSFEKVRASDSPKAVLNLVLRQQLYDGYRQKK